MSKSDPLVKDRRMAIRIANRSLDLSKAVWNYLADYHPEEIRKDPDLRNLLRAVRKFDKAVKENLREWNRG